MKLHELLETRARVVTEMRGLADKAETEKRDLNGDEENRFGELKAEIAGLDKKIERAQTLAAAERAAPAILVHGRGDGKFEERAREFSIVKAIRAALPRDVGGGGVDAGLEVELSREVEIRAGRKFQGIAVPDEIFLSEKRTLNAGTSAADLIPNVHRPDLFIDRLRSALVTERLGATVLDGLVGTVDIPRQTGNGTAQWVAEDGSLSETDAAFDDVTLAPKTVGAMTSYTRRTLISASPAIETIVRNDLARIIASAIDHQAMVGTGASNTPTGITNAGAAEIAFANPPTWAKVLEFIATVAGQNADLGSLGWAMNSWAVKKFREITKVSNDGGAGFLMDQPGRLADYPVGVTNSLPAAATGGSPSALATVIFGDWSSLLIGYWTGIDILLNPYETTAYAKGRVLVRAMRDVDVQLRHAESFTFADNLNVEG